MVGNDSASSKASAAANKSPLWLTIAVVLFGVALLGWQSRQQRVSTESVDATTAKSLRNNNSNGNPETHPPGLIPQKSLPTDWEVVSDQEPPKTSATTEGSSQAGSPMDSEKRNRSAQVNSGLPLPLPPQPRPPQPRPPQPRPPQTGPPRTGLPTPAAVNSARPDQKTSDESSSDTSVQVENQTIRNLDGRVVYKGTIDLKPTLDRIARGDANRHRNDGTSFQNRENRLPRKPAGYYKEYVHPTPGENGPGPQRVIIGKEGEVWYSADHYKTFKKIR